MNEVQLGSVSQDRIDLDFDGSNVNISRTLSQLNMTASLTPNPTSALAQSLGFLKGTADIEGASLNVLAWTSPDRKALAVLVCPADSCPVGDGTGSYDASSFRLRDICQ